MNKKKRLTLRIEILEDMFKVRGYGSMESGRIRKRIRELRLKRADITKKKLEKLDVW